MCLFFPDVYVKDRYGGRGRTLATENIEGITGKRYLPYETIAKDDSSIKDHIKN